MVQGDCIARAWENALLELFRSGCDVKTQYDKPDDPPSKDATMIVTVLDPLAEPMIHRDFPGGFEELEEYAMEVCEGIKDHCVRDPNDPQRHPLGIYLSSAPVPLRSALASAHRPDRAPVSKTCRNVAYPPCPSHHLESLGRRFVLRSRLPAKRLVPDHRSRRPAGAQHERPLPIERRLQGGLHEHVRPGPPAIEHRLADNRTDGQTGNARPILPHGR